MEDLKAKLKKFGFNNLSKDEFNAMVETARLAKLKEGGIYSESFVQGDELFRELSTDGTLDAALVGDRSKVVDTVKRVESLKKGLTDLRHQYYRRGTRTVYFTSNVG